MNERMNITTRGLIDVVCRGFAFSFLIHTLNFTVIMVRSSAPVARARRRPRALLVTKAHKSTRD